MMENSRKVSDTDIIDAISHVGVAAEKIEDARCLLAHIRDGFFRKYDTENEKHIHLISYYFESFAAYARILGICLDDLHSTISKADDVFFNVSAPEVTTAIEKDKESGVMNG